MNLLQLAPGGQLGRFIVWTQSAFNALDKLFGSQSKQAFDKKGYQLHRAVMSNGDLARIINSNEVQSIVRPARKDQVIHVKNKKNPLKNATLMEKLNPNDALRKKQERT